MITPKLNVHGNIQYKLSEFYFNENIIFLKNHKMCKQYLVNSSSSIVNY